LTVAEHFALEAPELRPLPDEPFDTAIALTCRVDNKSRVSVRQCFYSVPVRYAGHRIDVHLGAETVESLDGPRVVASHERLVNRSTQSLQLDHYLEVFKYKPGALPGATALAQARTAGAFGQAHERFWAEARRRLGDKEGTTALIDVLLLHRVMAHDEVVAGIRGALAVGSVDPAVVGVEARKHERRTPAPPVPIGGIGRFDRPKPTLEGYDDLLEARG
jgi:hypothetical protein